MTTFTIGRKAEAAAAAYLESQGYRILEQNWRTKWCEIDIVTKKDNVVYFVEVKYRSTTHQGSGIEYVTTHKLKQMEFAAASWVSLHSWAGDYRLAAIEVSGSDFAITGFIEDLT